MYHRVFDIENRLDEGMFLFGGRQVGKSTLLRERFPRAIYVDLLDPDTRKRFKRRSMEFYEMLVVHPPKTIVIVDEIQKLPELLDVVHKLMVENGLYFILSGSSARKIKRAGVNQLGGRANEEHLYPLVYAEIPDYDFDRAIQNGTIPRHYDVKDARLRIKNYVNLYLREEIEGEALAQNIDNFERFLEVAAITNTEILNYSNIASDCGVSVNTVKSYFRILYDTLLGFEVKPYRKVVKRKLKQCSKFYFFDVGIPNYLLRRFNLTPGTPEYGHAFESIVMQEIHAYLGYTGSDEELTYWHTYTNDEVDVVIGDARVAIEIKSADHVDNAHKKGLKRFAEEHPDAKLIVVSRDILTRRSGDVDLYYVTDFFKALWAGAVI